MSVPVVSPPRVEHLREPRGIGTARPRLSWVTATTRPGWLQAAYQVELDGDLRWTSGRVDGSAQLLVPWGAGDLQSRARVRVRVRVWGVDGSASEWSEATELETGLLSAAEWRARFVTASWEEPAGPSRPAVRFSGELRLPSAPVRARLYSTALGVYTATVNGAAVGADVLAPGWTSYAHRLLYQTYDVTDLLRAGSNELALVVADGWYRGRIGGEGNLDVYGPRSAALAQLEVTCEDGSTHELCTDDSWSAGTGPVREADLYDGESYDARLGWTVAGAAALLTEAPSLDVLAAPQSPPVRRTAELAVQKVITTRAGKTVLDFGQNLAGRARFTAQGPAGCEVAFRHGEVLEHGELCTRTLRTAKATDRYTFAGGGPETWEPSFTVHGFRYVEVSGWPGQLDPAAFTAVVVHCDLRRTGEFSCSDPLVDRLHQNIVWSMRGNVVSIPTDCPQRDERLGWTGDLQVFAPTAAFLFDSTGFLTSWLTDLAHDQRADGGVPFIVPDPPVERVRPPLAAAAWGDAAVLVPWDAYRASGDAGLLEAQYESMTAWVGLVAGLMGESHLWDSGFQFGDWLDPTAPPDKPAEARCDPYLAATAYAHHAARVLAGVAQVLGKEEDAGHWAGHAEAVRVAFQREYLRPGGLSSSDAQTAYALALTMDLVPEAARNGAAARLAALVLEAGHTIATGFMGTPRIAQALSSTGHEATAFRLLMQTESPSWLHPVTRGATTIWERWDALLPDGTVNGDGMTSFNHYALGAVGEWLHTYVGGLSAVEPGYRRSRITPHPGGGLTWATTRLDTPYGLLGCSWSVEGAHVSVAVDVPAGTTAELVLPGTAESRELGSGRIEVEYEVTADVARQWAAR
ncbi:MAG: putative rhamnosidase [Frankiales bacterium]|nr:putative rhamnosidase [Frankiales bacterium]